MPRGDMIVLRRDTLANWAAAEVSGPALAAGERGHITDLNVDVVGDGAKKVAQLTPVGSGTYAPLGLSRWKAKLASSPSTARVAFVGDSTSDAVTGAGYLYRRLMGLHTQPGEALDGVAAGDFYSDGATTSGSPTFTSASAAFTSADVGRLVVGPNFPLSTTITAVNSATSVTLGANLTSTATGVPFWIGRSIINGGNNGVLLGDWFAAPSGAFPYNRDKLVADNPDLIVYSWLFNDVRQGALGTTVAAVTAACITRLQSLVDWTRANLPNADILLRMPNTILSANVSNLNFVSDGTTVNAAGIAQVYSTALRRAYLYFVGRYSNVEVIDIQGEVYGTRSLASHPLNVDQLHPSVNVNGDINNVTPAGGGYCAIADAIAARIGLTRNAYPPATAARVRHEFIVYSAPSAGTVRLISRNAYDTPAPNAPVFPGDSLYVTGLETSSPITVASNGVDRIVSSTVLSLTGLGSTDFTPYIGKTAAVVGSHAPQSTGDRQQVFVDLPSIAAGATVTQTVSVSGLAPGHTGGAAGVVANPGGTFGSSGLLLLGAYPSAGGTVKLVIQNPTGAAIDLAGESWTFWVLR